MVISIYKTMATLLYVRGFALFSSRNIVTSQFG